MRLGKVFPQRGAVNARGIFYIPGLDVIGTDRRRAGSSPFCAGINRVAAAERIGHQAVAGCDAGAYRELPVMVVIHRRYSVVAYRADIGGGNIGSVYADAPAAKVKALENRGLAPVEHIPALAGPCVVGELRLVPQEAGYVGPQVHVD